MNTLDWSRKKMDLYEFHQTADLASLTWQRSIRGIYELLKTEVMSWVSSIPLWNRSYSSQCYSMSVVLCAGVGGDGAAAALGVGVVLAVRARRPPAGARRPAGRPPRGLHPVPGALAPARRAARAAGERRRRPPGGGVGRLGAQHGRRAAAAGAGRRGPPHRGRALHQPQEQHAGLLQGRPRVLPPGELFFHNLVLTCTPVTVITEPI